MQHWLKKNQRRICLFVIKCNCIPVQFDSADSRWESADLGTKIRFGGQLWIFNWSCHLFGCWAPPIFILISFFARSFVKKSAKLQNYSMKMLLNCLLSLSVCIALRFGFSCALADRGEAASFSSQNTLKTEPSQTILLTQKSPSTKILLTDPNCEPLLDDSSNYEIEKSSTSQYLTVRSKQLSENAASLLLDCPAGPIFLVLRYQNSEPTFGDNFPKPFKPSAYVDTRWSKSANSPARTELEYADATFESLQFRAMHSSPALSIQSEVVQSLDVWHASKNFQLLGGVTSKRTEIAPSRSLRGELSIFGVTGTMSETRSNKKLLESRESVLLPSPIDFRYLHLLSAEQDSETHSFEKSMLFMKGRYKNTASLSYERSNQKGLRSLDLLGFFNRAAFSFQENAEAAWILELKKPTGQIGKVSFFAFEWLISERKYSPRIRYSVIPNILETEHKLDLFSHFRFNLLVRKNFEEISFLKKSPWIEHTALKNKSWDYKCSTEGYSENYGRELTSRGSAMLEVCDKGWTLDPALSAGLSYNSGYWVISTAAYSKTFDWKSTWGVDVSLRRHLDANLSYASEVFSRHSAEIVTLSGFQDQAVPNVEFEWRREGGEWNRAQSSLNGVAVLQNPPAQGIIEMRTRLDSRIISLKVQKSLKVPDLKAYWRLPIYDVREVIFVLDLNGSGAYEKGPDTVLEIENEKPELKESIVTCDFCKASGKNIYVPAGKKPALTLHPELLDTGLSFGPEKQNVNRIQWENEKILILLSREKQ
jgi:hypothetical protein